ncbi:MAG: hypothetical protein LBG75_03130 [Candidatus Nomurabacteria bacterium]|nr:hypothetical protein [Candidatus Nomurabacteria bacterium]
MSELPEKQAKRLKTLIQEAEIKLAAAKELLMSILGEEEVDGSARQAAVESLSGKVVEGIFDGQNMIDGDGKNYPVPVNYASKSKLVEGDIMKLTITEEGKLVYKQIGPAPRKQLIGTLISHDGQYFVEVSGKEYKILLATVTYFKLTIGDQVTIIIPEDNPDAVWAAVEAKL